ncbi:hypothetical protein ACIRU3_33415 [Streptomyces sp. NPDC101151]
MGITAKATLGAAAGVVVTGTASANAGYGDYGQTTGCSGWTKTV